MSFLFEKSKAEKQVDILTNECLSEPDVGGNLNLIDSINSSGDGGRDVYKALKKRLSTFKSPRAQHLTLSLIEMCIKNCSPAFQQMIANKEMMDILYKIATIKLPVHAASLHELHQKQLVTYCLTLIESLAEAFSGSRASSLGGPLQHPSNALTLPCWQQLYEKLKYKEHVEFPPRDLNNLAPVFTPSPHAHNNNRAAPANNNAQHAATHASTTSHNATSTNSQSTAIPSNAHLYPSYTSLTPAYLTKLFSEFTLIYENFSLFLDLLRSLPSSSYHSDPSIQMLVAQFNQFQSRLSYLIVELVDETLVDLCIRCLESVRDMLHCYHTAIKHNIINAPNIQLPEILRPQNQQQYIQNLLHNQSAASASSSPPVSASISPSNSSQTANILQLPSHVLPPSSSSSSTSSLISSHISSTCSSVSSSSTSSSTVSSSVSPSVLALPRTEADEAMFGTDDSHLHAMWNQQHITSNQQQINQSHQL